MTIRNNGTAFLRSPGSKHRSAPRLSALQPRTRCSEYREAYVGSGGIFFNLAENAFDNYWLNDKNADIITAYETLQGDHDGEFRQAVENIRALRHVGDALQVYFRGASHRFTKREHSTLDFLFLNRHAYGQMVRRERKNGATFDRSCMKNEARSGLGPLSADRLAFCHRRLQGVKLTCEDFEPVISAPAEHGPVWIFLDPPYLLHNANHHGQPIYGETMGVSEHIRLFELLLACPHRWLMTISECKFVLRHYLVRAASHRFPFKSSPGLNCLPLPLTYTGMPRFERTSNGKRHRRHSPRVTELILWNYDD
jgi:site-specific DNA-adenine methylase